VEIIAINGVLVLHDRLLAEAEDGTRMDIDFEMLTSFTCAPGVTCDHEDQVDKSEKRFQTVTESIKTASVDGSMTKNMDEAVVEVKAKHPELSGEGVGFLENLDAAADTMTIEETVTPESFVFEDMAEVGSALVPGESGGDEKEEDEGGLVTILGGVGGACVLLAALIAGFIVKKGRDKANRRSRQHLNKQLSSGVYGETIANPMAESAMAVEMTDTKFANTLDFREKAAGKKDDNEKPGVKPSVNPLLNSFAAGAAAGGGVRARAASGPRRKNKNKGEEEVEQDATPPPAYVEAGEASPPPPMPPTAPPPSVWVRILDEQSGCYYKYNKQTGESVWEK
jgi:hypothetical protein